MAIISHPAPLPEKIKLRCPYCKNISGKMDDYGGCISCGGRLEEIKQETTFPNTSIPIYATWYGRVLSPEEARSLAFSTGTNTIYNKYL